MKELPKKHRFRAILAQAIAVMVKNFLLFDLGLSVAFPVILIPALTGLSSETNPHETINITGAQASWLGSSLHILTIFGSAVSGIITEPMGRKKSMLFVNIPHLFGWLVLYFATSLTHVFVGVASLGLGIGLMEAPIITYVGEICEASVRDVMLASSGLSSSVAFLVIFFIGSWLEWRTVALVSSSIPLAALILLMFIPETPIWLLSQQRDEDASKSLQWLRGWVSETEIAKELNDLKLYRDYAKACSECRSSGISCTHPLPSLMHKIKELSKASYVKPMMIITIASFFSGFTGAHHVNPYVVQILNTYQTPMSPNNVTVLFGLTALAGTTCCILIAKFISKRAVFLITIATATILNIWLGVYGLYHLPQNAKSYEHAQVVIGGENGSYIPVILVVVWRFVTAAIMNIPIMYASELFPLKSRCIAAGISIGTTYIYLFVAMKTFYNLEYWLNMSEAFCIYAVVGVIGLYVCYKILPATEDRTLEEIEKHYNNSRKRLTDWRIEPSKRSSLKIMPNDETSFVPSA